MSYASSRAMAQRLLRKKGTLATLTRVQQGAINPITGRRAAGSNLISTFYVVGLPPNASAEFEVGSIIGRQVMNFYMSRVSGTLDPFPGDNLLWKAKSWKIIQVAQYDPDGSGAIFYRAYGEIS